MGIMADNKAIQLKNKQAVTDLQKFYVNGQLDNLETVIEERKNELVDKIIDYNLKFRDEQTGLVANKPYLVSTYFFKTINPLGNIEPEYSPEKLNLVFQLYMYLVEQVNIEIGDFIPTKTHFCQFAGITTATLNRYKSSPISEMRTIVDKIYDACFDSSMTMAQNKRFNEKTTIFRAKTELDVTEKPQTHVNINANIVDINNINERLERLKAFNTKK